MPNNAIPVIPGNLVATLYTHPQTAETHYAVAPITDLTNWTLRGHPTIDGRQVLSDGNTLFVYNNVGAGARTSKSTDGGVTWVDMPESITGTDITNMAWNGQIYIGMPFSTDIFITSNDGINWTFRTLPTSGPWMNPIWNGSIWLTFGGNTPYTSTDGINWISGTPFSFYPVYGGAICWSGSFFIVAPDHGTTWKKSIDGLTWINVTGPIVVWPDFAVLGSTIYCVSGGENYLYVSTNGTSWSNVSLTGILPPLTSGVSYFCTVHNTLLGILRVTSDTAQIIMSSDGVNWEVVVTNALGMNTLTTGIYIAGEVLFVPMFWKDIINSEESDF